MPEAWYFIETTTLLTILAMAVGTYVTRIGGIVLVRFFTLSGRIEAALQAVPPAILMAIIAPKAFATGPEETVATILTALAAMKLPLLPSIGVGVASLAIMRAYPVLSFL
ncbi:AzlD family protein [Flexibacterium corallicola]|uniref:AzlD family protein n=1 Tax=Flexibacterium corallicola TaxID=3037259 RepID=UPI00286ED502|nr:AzlD family protein [Pseudovibrio sp. M1P-2-3]